MALDKFWHSRRIQVEDATKPKDDLFLGPHTMVPNGLQIEEQWVPSVDLVSCLRFFEKTTPGHHDGRHEVWRRQSTGITPLIQDCFCAVLVPVLMQGGAYQAAYNAVNSDSIVALSRGAVCDVYSQRLTMNRSVMSVGYALALVVDAKTRRGYVLQCKYLWLIQNGGVERLDTNYSFTARVGIDKDDTTLNIPFASDSVLLT